MGSHLTEVMIFLPVLASLVLGVFSSVIGGQENKITKQISLVSSVLASVAALILVFTIRTGTPEIQASEIISWVGAYSIAYEVGVDGLNVAMILLIAIIFPVLIASEWKSKKGLVGIHSLFLVMQAAFFGVVLSQDLFLQFFFLALSSLPIHFMIAIWGAGKKEEATFRYMVTMALSNALIFSALVLVYYAAQPHTFSLKTLMTAQLATKTFPFFSYDIQVAPVSFALLAIGVALRAPVWPFHGWFTRVAETAPASVFSALCAVNLPVSFFLFVRLAYSLFPETVTQVSFWIVILGSINLFVGGFSAAGQREMKKLVAYLSITGSGLILLGIGSLSQAGVVGALYECLCFGLGIAGLNLLIGLIDERSGKTEFKTSQGEKVFSGLIHQAPYLGLFAGIMVASLLGFPGLGGFVGYSLLVVGSYSVNPVMVLVVSLAGLVVTYLLFSAFRNVFFGEVTEAEANMADLSLREKAFLIPLVLSLMAFGVYPRPLLELIRPTAITLLSVVK